MILTLAKIHLLQRKEKIAFDTKSVTSKKNDSKKAEESTDDEIGPYLSRNPIDDVTDFIDNNLLDNSINTYNGDDVSSEVMSPAKS